MRSEAQELLRKRVSAGGNSSFQECLCELSLMDTFGIEGDWLPNDQSGRSIRVLVQNQQIGPWLVNSRLFDADIFVFMMSSWETATVLGWCSRRQIENSPVSINYNEKDSPKQTIHKIDKYALWPLPETYDFEEHKHSVSLWDKNREGWDCLGCDTLVYDAYERIKIANG